MAECSSGRSPGSNPGICSVHDRQVPPASTAVKGQNSEHEHEATGDITRGAFLQAVATTGIAVAWGAVARTAVGAEGPVKAGAEGSSKAGAEGSSKAAVFGEVRHS